MTVIIVIIVITIMVLIIVAIILTTMTRMTVIAIATVKKSARKQQIVGLGLRRGYEDGCAKVHTCQMQIPNRTGSRVSGWDDGSMDFHKDLAQFSENHNHLFWCSNRFLGWYSMLQSSS